jgi:hypothetical protein
MANLDVLGHSVSYDASSRIGIDYLINMGYDKADVIFNKAVENGSTTFEYQGGGYKLSWVENSNYTLVKKY